MSRGEINCAQVIVSSPGSPSSEESASPEPINKANRNGLAFTNGATQNMPTTTTVAAVTTASSIMMMMMSSSAIEQITPTSSVDTEEGNPPQLEERERGIEGDVEASDDDLISKRNKS